MSLSFSEGPKSLSILQSPAIIMRDKALPRNPTDKRWRTRTQAAGPATSIAERGACNSTSTSSQQRLHVRSGATASPQDTARPADTIKSTIRPCQHVPDGVSTRNEWVHVGGGGDLSQGKKQLRGHILFPISYRCLSCRSTLFPALLLYYYRRSIGWQVLDRHAFWLPISAERGRLYRVQQECSSSLLSMFPSVMTLDRLLGYKM